MLLVVAVVLAAFALPSALILPQASPTQTLEYAPVPANGQSPPGGNVSALGLGSTGTLGSNGAGGISQPPPAQGSSPSDKQCIGNPPRQTEDPLAPPCVPFFNGDNGGSTHMGVTGSQIVVLFYEGAYFMYTDCNTNYPTMGYFDISAGQSDGTCVSKNLAVWEAYFNHRFQTYKRFVHFWLYVSSAQDAAGRRAEAEDNYQRLHPFAVAAPSAIFAGPHEDAYQQALNEHGVLYFTAQTFEPSSLFQTYAPLLWGYAPSAEEQARNWATYVCSKIEPFPSDFAGPLQNGRPRTYGAIETTDSSKPLLSEFQALAIKQVHDECGIRIQATATYPVDGFWEYSGPNSSSYSKYAAPEMASFAQQNITTILWPGGYETQFSAAAAQLKYYPEWVLAGDGNSDAFDPGATQDATEWAHAIVITPQPRVANGDGSSTCIDAYRSTNPSPAAMEVYYGCGWYASIFQLFVGIQVAGPNLTPGSINDGFHAIPPHPSGDPEVPACYYDSGDYTCVKDGTAMYWSSSYPNPYRDEIPGCWLMPQGGRRYLTGRWPAGSATAGRSAADTCNGYQGTALIYGGAPGTG